MPAIIKVSAQYSEQVEEIVRPMCEKIVSRGDQAFIFPLPGYLHTIIQHLSSNQIQYDIDHTEPG